VQGDGLTVTARAEGAAPAAEQEHILDSAPIRQRTDINALCRCAVVSLRGGLQLPTRG
jgi:uncharacterized protein YvpB